MVLVGLLASLAFVLAVVALVLTLFYKKEEPKRVVYSDHGGQSSLFIFDPSYKGTQTNVFRDFRVLYRALRERHGHKRIQFISRRPETPLELPVCEHKSKVYDMEDVEWFASAPTQLHLVSGVRITRLELIQGPLHVSVWTQDHPVMVRDLQNPQVRNQAQINLRIVDRVVLENRGLASFLEIESGNTMHMHLGRNTRLSSSGQAPLVCVKSSQSGLFVHDEDGTTTVEEGALVTSARGKIHWFVNEPNPSSKVPRTEKKNPPTP